MKKSKLILGQVLKCEFSTTWENPITKKLIYYHDIVTDMGDKGSCGTVEMYSPRIAVGAFIEYEIDDKGKIKIHESSADKGSDLAIGENNKIEKVKRNKYNQSEMFEKPETHQIKKQPIDAPKIKGQEAFLGYAWSYAKDLLIAGKTMKDMKLLKDMATFIYDEIGEHIKNGRIVKNDD